MIFCEGGKIAWCTQGSPVQEATSYKAPLDANSHIATICLYALHAYSCVSLVECTSWQLAICDSCLWWVLNQPIFSNSSRQRDFVVRWVDSVFHLPIMTVLKWLHEPVLRGQPLLGDRLTFHRGWPLTRGLTVLWLRSPYHWFRLSFCVFNK